MIVVWFKRDLRTHDHSALARAAAEGSVLPLYIVEPGLWQQADVSERQWLFATECLNDLDDELGRLGQRLVVRVGSAIDVFTDLHATHGISRLLSHEETGNAWTYARDLAVKDWCRARQIDWVELPQNGVFRAQRSRDGWAARWHQRMKTPLTPAPTALKPVAVASERLPLAADLGLKHDGCDDRQAGGRSAALATLESFLMQRGRPYRKAMSAPAAGAEHCSRLSPHLAWGSLSMREVAQATRLRREQLDARPDTGEWRQSMRSFSSRLHWHCHFMQKLEDEPELEHRNLHPAYNGLRESDGDSAYLDAWQRGETGLPFLDACMRSLRATGWINFRMRAMLMAFASYQLWLDWRAPGEHLARLFTDYEPGIHWSQVQMQSGTTGINTPRIYNPVKQGYDQDADGSFIRRWVPELADVPGQLVHEPWRWEGAAALLGDRYPAPIVDHAAAARRARQRIWQVRKGGEHRRIANDIVRQHGSRRAAPRRGRRSTTARQASFGFNGDNET